MLSLAERLSGAEEERAVWDVYAGTEKLIAILKFRLDYETHGAFTRLPEAGDQAKLLKVAHQQLSKAAEEIAGGMLVECITTLREARNNLRSYLTERRKSATRADKKKRVTPPGAESKSTTWRPSPG